MTSQQNIVTVFVVLLMRGPGAGDPRPQVVQQRCASQDFFADYVGLDGRVIRHDHSFVLIFRYKYRRKKLLKEILPIPI